MSIFKRTQRKYVKKAYRVGASAIKCWWLPRNPLVC